MNLRQFLPLLMLITLLTGACGQAAEQYNKPSYYNRYWVEGKRAYEQYCGNCHGLKGEGFKSLYPPLNATNQLAGGAASIAEAVKFGRKGQVVVGGKVYDQAMPAVELSALETAAIMVYIMNEWHAEGDSVYLYTTQDIGRIWRAHKQQRKNN